MKIKLKKNIALCLDDCSKKQLIEIVRISNDTRLLSFEKKVKCFFVILKNQGNFLQKIYFWFELMFKPWWISTRLGEYIHTEKGLNIDITVSRYDDDDFIDDVLDYTDFLFDTTQESSLLKQKIKSLGLWLKGPEDYFGNVTFGMWRNADTAFYTMLEQKEQTGEMIISDDFIRALYLPRFEFFNPKKLKISDEVKQIILMYYVGNRKLLTLEFTHVFKQKKGSSSFGNYEDYTVMWENILDSVAERPQYYSVVDSLNIRSVLKNLDQRFAKNEALQQAYDNARLH